MEPGFEGKVVDKILISPKERFADPLNKYRSQRLCQSVIVPLLRALLRHGSKVNSFFYIFKPAYGSLLH